MAADSYPQGISIPPDEGGFGSEDQTDQCSKEHPWMVMGLP
ncbi:hypothetical protein CK203_071660 [Vitis vinifera]|uniref:Uncharacterized protein n=1 Tax=Vitis vinifera TaxID=29760 RepID=A0A438F4H0_VITVI|nr:hypothetical protein CK203_071660 [Vitis vinifera]